MKTENVVKSIFVDTAIHQGWLQWCDDIGNEYRAERKGSIWHLYEKIGDAFIHVGFSRIYIKPNIKNLKGFHNAIQKNVRI